MVHEIKFSKCVLHPVLGECNVYLCKMNKTLLVVAGPTASGKTALGIRLAQHYQTIVLSGDSRQFYKEMNIGTAKPTPDELAAAPHYFVGHLSIQMAYNVGDFERDALTLLQTHFQTQDQAILVGGSGLYIKAVCEGLDHYPEVPPEVREALIQDWQTEGLEALQQELANSDPVYYAQMDQQNPHRLIRAFPVFNINPSRPALFKPAPWPLLGSARPCMPASTNGWTKWWPKGW